MWPLDEPGGLKAFDVSGYRKDGTLTNMDAATCHVVTPMGRALDFLAVSSQYISHSSLVLGAVYTVAGWVKNPTNGNGSPWAGASNNYWMNLVSGATIYHMAGTGVLDYWSWAAKTFTGWHQWCVVRTGLVATLYKDGVSQGTGTRAGAGAGAGALTLTSIGKYGVNYDGMSAFNFAAWNRLLSDAEVLCLYTDPGGMYRLRRRVQARGAAATGNRRRRILIAGARR